MKKKRLLEDLIVKPLDMRRCAEQIGLKWSEAIRLYEEGFLSFNPDTTAITTDAMSVEFDFLGRLVVAGCNSKLLKILLRDLEKPYIYELRKHYYDWVKGTWQPIPKLNSLVDFIECQIDVAFDNDDINALYDLGYLVDASIEVMNEQMALNPAPDEEEEPIEEE